MQDLTVIGVENGALLVSSDGGERFRIVIDELLQSRLRQGIASAQGGKKVSPREIQTHIRAGLSAFEVAELTGASVDYVERFEGPVVAERQFIVDSALRVAVQPTTPADPLGEEPLSTFGDALDERLEGLDARDVRWASWKDETGWIVKLTFTSREIDHDARWQFDPKRHVLSPLNSEATTLSRHGELTEGLIPRLRAVSNSSEVDAARFDSGAFASVERAPEPEPVVTPAPDAAAEAEAEPEAPAQPVVEVPAASALPARPSREHGRPYDGFAIKRAPDTADTNDHNQTADLLEALRRRRGEREAASFDPQPEEPTIFGGPRAVAEPFDTPLEGLETELMAPPRSESGAPGSAAQGSGGQGSGSRQSSPKRQRAAMPSWDEIVFGARSDDDPA
ncbi:septation protein SepH [Herbiconiux daphne]|uniref:Septation protein SepH n=1 Tax=Herbiconiux daphne TaxID=2970914 RepID=A0ABT2GZ13_9MICO|nr:septation protein SepH [Herbiconiux daphne]MCS5733202.1 septation protein SepH [Herbiconiux daphne]